MGFKAAAEIPQQYSPKFPCFVYFQCRSAVWLLRLQQEEVDIWQEVGVAVGSCGCFRGNISEFVVSERRSGDVISRMKSTPKVSPTTPGGEVMFSESGPYDSVG